MFTVNGGDVASSQKDQEKRTPVRPEDGGYHEKQHLDKEEFNERTSETSLNVCFAPANHSKWSTGRTHASQ